MRGAVCATVMLKNSLVSKHSKFHTFLRLQHSSESLGSDYIFWTFSNISHLYRKKEEYHQKEVERFPHTVKLLKGAQSVSSDNGDIERRNDRYSRHATVL